MGEIQCWIKLRAKTKYEIFLFSTTGLNPNTIRQRLLENRSLDLNTAIDQARVFYTVQKNSECYSRPFQPIGAVKIKNSDTSVIENCAAAPNNTNSRCYICNGPRHDRQNCLARESTCYRCNEISHSSKVCRSRPTHMAASTCTSTETSRLATVINNSICLPEKVTSSFSVVSSARMLKQTTIFVLIGKKKLPR